MEMGILIAVIVVALATIAFVAYNFFKIKKMDEGTEEMSEIAAAIRVGANAFINYEYKVIAIVAAVVAVLLCVLVCWEQAVCFILGAIMSATAGYIGMKVATYANVRVSNTAAISLYESAGYRLDGVRPGFYRNPTEDAAIYSLYF